MKSSGTNGQKTKLTDDQLSEALFKIEDVLGRMLVTFCLLGETARSLRDSPRGGEGLKGDKIEIGVEKKYLTKEALSTFDVYEPDKEKTETGWKLTYNGVPVEIKVITQKYSFFKHPDFRFYRAGEYLLPNPFKEYWKIRGIVR